MPARSRKPAGPRRIRSLTLRRRRWRVRWVRGLAGDDGKPLLGLCEHAKSVISLEADQTPRVLLDTILHEVLHASFPLATERNVRIATPEILAALARVGFRLVPRGSQP